MIIKSWKFKGFTSEIPDWVKLESSKRAGNPDLWVHTQRGEEPAKKGQGAGGAFQCVRGDSGHLDFHKGPASTSRFWHGGGSPGFHMPIPGA